MEIVVAFYHIGVGNWDLAREQLETVRQIAQRLGDRRRLDDAIGNLAELESLQGSFELAAALAEELIDNATARNDDRYRAEALAELAVSSWQLGDTDRALRSLAALELLMAGDLELTDELRIKFGGLRALVHASRQEWQAARTAADQTMDLTAHQRPTYFGTFLGYAGPAEAYLSLLEAGQAGTHGRRQTADALGRLRGYASVFPVGRPRSALLEGRHHWLRGKPDAANRSWRNAIRLAEELSMPYELALAHYELARHLDPQDPARAGHLAASRDLFNRLQAARDLARMDRIDGDAGRIV